MPAGFVQSHIARGNRNIGRMGMLLIAGGVGVAALFWHWFPLISVVFGVMMLTMWLKRILNPRAHPVYLQLARYGEPDLVARELDSEFAEVKPSDQTQFGETWLAQGNMYGLDVVPWQEIAWLHVSSRRAGRVVTRHAVRVWSRDGSQFLAPPHPQGYVKKEQAEELLRALSRRAPWAEVGFSSTLQTQWQEQRTDFVKRVDARRALTTTAR